MEVYHNSQKKREKKCDSQVGSKEDLFVFLMRAGALSPNILSVIVSTWVADDIRGERN